MEQLESRLILRLERGRKEDPLEFVVLQRLVRGDLLERLVVLVVKEEDVGLVDHEAA